MTKIVKFPKERRALPTDPGTVTVRRVCGVLRTPLFLALYWLRLPVLMVCKLFSGPLLLAFLAGLIFFPDYRHIAFTAGAVSFGAFVVQWLYDSLLLRLSPDELLL